MNDARNHHSSAIRVTATEVPWPSEDACVLSPNTYTQGVSPPPT